MHHHNTIVHLVGSVRNIWMQMVHTFKGQYDGIKCETDEAMLQCLKFITYRKKGPFLTLQNARPMWCLTPPIWLFPQPIT